MEAVEAAVERLRAKRRTCRFTRAANAAAYIAAVALFFFPTLRPVGLALMAAGVLFHILVSRRLSQSYRAEAAEANLRFGLCNGTDSFAYLSRGGLSYDDFRAWAVAPIREGEGSLLCRDSFTARDGGIPITGQEATFHYETPNAGGKGSVRFLSGVLLTAGSPGRTGWLLVRPDVFEPNALAAFLAGEGYEPRPEPPKGWMLYAQTDAGELSQGTLRRLAALEERVSVLRLTQTGAAAFLNGRFYTGVRYPSIEPTVQLLRENLLPERDALWTLYQQWFLENKTK